jgi:hypothetical protein
MDDQRLGDVAELGISVFKLVGAYDARLSNRGYRIGLGLFYGDIAWAIDLAIAFKVPFVMENYDSFITAATALRDRVDQIGPGDPTEMELPRREEYWYDQTLVDRVEIVVSLAKIFEDQLTLERTDWHRNGEPNITVGEIFDVLWAMLVRTRRWRVLSHRRERANRPGKFDWYRFGWVAQAERELKRVTKHYGEPPGIDRVATVGDGTGPWSGGPG